MINAIILSGDRNNAFSDGRTKALIKIMDKAMIEYVVKALKASSCINKIAVVGSADELKPCLSGKVDHVVQGSDDLLENVLKGIQLFKADHRVLLLTCDIPFITAEAIDHFVAECSKTGADLCYPIVAREDNEARFPGTRRTYARLKEGTFTGGNLIYVNPKVIERSMGMARQMIAYRKKPWKMCRVLGWDFVLRLALGNLTITGVEERVSGLLSISVAAIRSPYAEIGNDVDKEEDLEKAREFMKRIG
jgi:molybdopterin-guanine dinucleotide biosynthesis protein A